MYVQVNMRIDSGLLHALKVLAAVRGVTMTSIIDTALRQIDGIDNQLKVVDTAHIDKQTTTQKGDKR